MKSKAGPIAQPLSQAMPRLISPKDLPKFIDHTLLKPEATRNDIDRLCGEARRFGFKGVCVNSVYVPLVRELLGDSPVLTVAVVGFPLGATPSQAKAFETELAVGAGAQEIDMVIALGPLKDQRHSVVEADIRSVVRAAGSAPVKVILETGLLRNEEIVHGCRVAEAAGAAFVKTATGFLGRGATVDDVRLMRQSLTSGVEIKASGGIKSFGAAKALIEAGATRLGTSSGVALVEGDGAASGAY